MIVLPVLAHNSPAPPRPALPCPALRRPALTHPAILFICPAVQALHGCAGSAVVWPELHVRLPHPLPPGLACASSRGEHDDTLLKYTGSDVHC